MSRRRAFTDAELMAVYRPGMGSYRLAAALGVSQKVAWKWMRRLGLPHGTCPGLDEGWQDGPKARLRRLWIAGVAVDDIAADLGVSRNAVIGKAHRMDLGVHPSLLRRAA